MTAYSEENWKAALSKFEAIFGPDMTMDALLFVIGVQELGQGPRVYSKDEKMNLAHLAVCKLLSQFGYYHFSHFDNDKWPHYERAGNLPELSKKEQEKLLKQAIINYSETNI